MDTKQYAQGDKLTIDFVKKCPPQKNIGVIVSDVKETDTSYGKRLVVMVNINDCLLSWTMNATSVNNMQKLGSDSLKWLSKRVAFVVNQDKGKDRLIGEPLLD